MILIKTNRDKVLWIFVVLWIFTVGIVDKYFNDYIIMTNAIFMFILAISTLLQNTNKKYCDWLDEEV